MATPSKLCCRRSAKIKTKWTALAVVQDRSRTVCNVDHPAFSPVFFFFLRTHFLSFFSIVQKHAARPPRCRFMSRKTPFFNTVLHDSKLKHFIVPRKLVPDFVPIFLFLLYLLIIYFFLVFFFTNCAIILFVSWLWRARKVSWRTGRPGRRDAGMRETAPVREICGPGGVPR